MFHGVNELKKKVYPPHRPAALEAARRKRLSDVAGRSAVLDTAGPDVDAKSAGIADESRAAFPEAGRMKA